MAPFEVQGASAEKQVDGIMALPETFPSTVAVLPASRSSSRQHRAEDGSLTFPDGVSARTLLQQATRDTLTGMGLDVSGLTDAQMSDNHGWVLFPNFFMTIRAGECHVIMAVPHPDGDPNRCIWHVASYMYLPAEMRDAFKVDLIEVDEPGSYKYFEALHQDYIQMPRQQLGLRNTPPGSHDVGQGGSGDRALPLRHRPLHGRAPLKLEDRIALHTRMAKAYGDAYLRQGVQDGEAFVDVWKFADDAVYASPVLHRRRSLQVERVSGGVGAGVHHGGEGLLAALPGLEAGGLQVLAG